MLIVPVAGADAWLIAEPPSAPTSAAEAASDSTGWLATAPATERKKTESDRRIKPQTQERRSTQNSSETAMTSEKLFVIYYLGLD